MLKVGNVVFSKASLVELDGHQRLSFPNLETWSASARPSLAEAGVDWPQRVATHCHYMADKVTLTKGRGANRKPRQKFFEPRLT